MIELKEVSFDPLVKRAFKAEGGKERLESLHAAAIPRFNLLFQAVNDVVATFVGVHAFVFAQADLQFVDGLDAAGGRFMAEPGGEKGAEGVFQVRPEGYGRLRVKQRKAGIELSLSQFCRLLGKVEPRLSSGGVRRRFRLS